MQSQNASAIIIPTLRNSTDAAELTNLAATETGFFKFVGGNLAQRFTICNSTGNDVYIKFGVQLLATAVSVDWYHVIIPSGVPVDFAVACDKIGVYIPAGGTTLEYKSATKNFAVFGFNLGKKN